MTWTRSTAYPCSTYGCDEPGAWREVRSVKPNGLPLSMGFYGACEFHHDEALKHHKPRNVDPGTPVPDPAPRAVQSDVAASQSIVREVPVGIVEIAAWLEVRRGTCDRWINRGIFPEPDMRVSNHPLWWSSTISDWARATGRLPA